MLIHINVVYQYTDAPNVDLDRDNQLVTVEIHDDIFNQENLKRIRVELYKHSIAEYDLIGYIGIIEGKDSTLTGIITEHNCNTTLLLNNGEQKATMSCKGMKTQLIEPLSRNTYSRQYHPKGGSVLGKVMSDKPSKYVKVPMTSVDKVKPIDIDSVIPKDISPYSLGS